MSTEKGSSSGHEIPEEERREQNLEETDHKKDENEENKDEAEAEEEVILNEAEEEEDKEDGDGDEEEKKEDSPDSNSGDQSDEFIEIDSEVLLKEVACPICLGIIKKTKAVMKCLHRFCGECIEKSLRLGNNECPVCRAHCPSRRSLRDDPYFDAFIAKFFPDIDKFEEEALNEEEKSRNNEIQESIAQVSERKKLKKGSTSGSRGENQE